MANPCGWDALYKSSFRIPRLISCWSPWLSWLSLGSLGLPHCSSSPICVSQPYWWHLLLPQHVWRLHRRLDTWCTRSVTASHIFGRSAIVHPHAKCCQSALVFGSAIWRMLKDISTRSLIRLHRNSVSKHEYSIYRLSRRWSSHILT